MRNVLVRVIVPTAAESRDRIIKATNSQTAIPPASLRATDRIHRDIEQYLKTFTLYYDRRKNYYKNEGKLIEGIISIPQMAQAIMAIVLQRPDTARARPSSLIKKDDEYQRLFNASYPIEAYRTCAVIKKRVESYLIAHMDNLTSADRNNIRFYVAMVVPINALKKAKPSIEDIASFAGAAIKDEILESSYQCVKKHYYTLGASDQTAKGPNLLECIKKEIVKQYLVSEASVQ